MPEPTSFRGRLDADGRGRRRVTALVALLVVAFVGIAIAKPWAAAAPVPLALGPSLTATPNGTAGPGPSPAATPSAPILPTATPGKPLPDAFTTPVPPPATAPWTSIRWRRLAQDDPLTLVRSMLRWRGGFIAIGGDSLGAVATPPVWTSMWTSTDGAHWEPLPVGTSTTFWPGLGVLGVAEVPAGLVALTGFGARGGCGTTPPCPATVISWTSSEGRAWTPHGFSPLGPSSPTGAEPLLAIGPAGLLVVSAGSPAHAATSADGDAWQILPDSTIPTDFLVADARGTATGYVLGGARMSSATHGDAAVLWSPTGRAWTAAGILPSLPNLNRASPPSTQTSTVDSFLIGSDGLIALGRWIATPGAAIWWHSPDGRDWRTLDGYVPLGPGPANEIAGGGPYGTLVGDGHRMVALRGGRDAGAWTSPDGLAWTRLPVTGDLPAEQATDAVLLPGGVLLTDGTTTWFGEAGVS